MDDFRTRSLIVGLVTLVFAYSSTAPIIARAQSEDSVARFCLGAAAALATSSDEYIPVFLGPSPPQRGTDSYWRHSFRGVSVPIPMDSDGWAFWFGDSNHVKGLAGLSHERLNISYGFVPSSVSEAIAGVAKLATELGLPATSLSPMELIRLALEIDSEDVECDPNQIQSTVNNLSAVYMKSFILPHSDRAYLHGDGVLGFSEVNRGELWTFLFEGDEPGRIFQIEIRNENQDRYPYIGFEIDDKVMMDALYSPRWMPLFFEAASKPSKDRLLQLREVISDYSLPEQTSEVLDEKIAQFE